MDWGNIIAIVLGGGGVIGLIVQGILNRRVTRAQARQIESQAKQTNAEANTTNADYAAKIIEQADKRVSQYEADAENARADRDEARAERDKWQEECRGQRKAKQEWRGKYEEAVSRIHELELENKDKDATIAESKWHECRRPDQECSRRIPPRNRESQNA